MLYLILFSKCILTFISRNSTNKRSFDIAFLAGSTNKNETIDEPRRRQEETKNETKNCDIQYKNLFGDKNVKDLTPRYKHDEVILEDGSKSAFTKVDRHKSSHLGIPKENCMITENHPMPSTLMDMSTIPRDISNRSTLNTNSDIHESSADEKDDGNHSFVTPKGNIQSMEKRVNYFKSLCRIVLI